MYLQNCLLFFPQEQHIGVVFSTAGEPPRPVVRQTQAFLLQLAQHPNVIFDVRLLGQLSLNLSLSFKPKGPHTLTFV